MLALPLGAQFSVTECPVPLTPAPSTVIVLGEALALLEIVTFPVTLPATFGANVTFNSAVCPAAMVAPATPLGSGVAGATIAAGQTAELKVTFAPKVAGSVTGKVTISSNASASPSTITVEGAGVSGTGHSVTLNWAPSGSANIVGYYVYRMSLLDMSYAKLTSSAVTGLKYTDTSVSAGETYYYAVTAVNSSGAQSGYSDQAVAIIP